MKSPEWLAKYFQSITHLVKLLILVVGLNIVKLHQSCSCHKNKALQFCVQVRQASSLRPHPQGVKSYTDTHPHKQLHNFLAERAMFHNRWKQHLDICRSFFSVRAQDPSEYLIDGYKDSQATLGSPGCSEGIKGPVVAPKAS